MSSGPFVFCGKQIAMADVHKPFIPLKWFAQSLLNHACVAGVDEAGRGPALGPMVYTVFVARADKHKELKERLGAQGIHKTSRSM